MPTTIKLEKGYKDRHILILLGAYCHIHRNSFEIMHVQSPGVKDNSLSTTKTPRNYLKNLLRSDSESALCFSNPFTLAALKSIVIVIQ